MKTKRELFFELKEKEKIIGDLSSLKSRHKELLEYITKTNYIIFKFAQEVNHQFDIDNIVNNARKIIQEHFSSNSEIFIDKSAFSGSGASPLNSQDPSQRWITASGSKHIEDVKEIMNMQKIIFIPNTIKMESFIGEHRPKLVNETNLGFQHLYKKWYMDKFKTLDNFNDFLRSFRTKEYLEEEFHKLRKIIKNDVDEKIILCHKKGISSFAAIPLVKNNTTIGYFQLITKHGDEQLIEEQIPLLNTLANLTVIAIINAEKYNEELYIDYRTGLPKRRLLFKYIEEAIRNKKHFSIMLTDIDNFKQYVDTFGHQAGQKAIDDFGYLARSKLRKDAKIAVLGGDEYVIFLPESNKEIASNIGEEIRQAVSNYLFDNELEGGRKIKVSVGVSDFSDIKSLEIKDQIKEIIKNADDALFHAKQKGRDRVCVWDESLPSTRDANVGR